SPGGRHHEGADAGAHRQRNATLKAGAATTQTPLASDAFARLFEALHEGVFIGLVDQEETATLAANPYLRVMFGWAEDVPTSDVRPFDVDRFVDDETRAGFMQQLARDGSANAYLLR